MSASPAPIDGIVVGLSGDGKPTLTAQDLKAHNLGDLDVAAQFVRARGKASVAGSLKVLHSTTSDDAPAIAAVSLGVQKPAPSTAPDALPESKEIFLRNEMLERTRRAAAAGVRAIRDLGAPTTTADAAKSSSSSKKEPTPRSIAVDPMYSAHAAAVGANLALFTFNHFKTRGGPEKAGHGLPANLQGGQQFSVVPLAGEASSSKTEALKDEKDPFAAQGALPPLSWHTGEVYAQGQNWARELKETPANHLTPTIFAKRVVDAFKGIPNTQVNVHDEDWAREKGMNVYLSVTEGSEEPAKFVEIQYNGAPADANAPVLGLVGKGVCFDTGGISLKPGAGMGDMRSDMGGFAAVVSAVRAIAQLKVPINLVAAGPLVENMPDGKATKPGDIFTAMNGLTVEVDNTDAEGRLILSDALTYISRTYKPHTLIDIATLTGAIIVALGNTYSGAFVEDESLWQELKAAGEAEHDRFWRMPLDDEYLKLIDGFNADLRNTGKPAGSCTAAIFLKQFVEGLEDREKLVEGSNEGRPTVRYAHLDIAGAASADRPTPYQDKGMYTGRPVRALVEFARRFAVLHATPPQ